MQKRISYIAALATACAAFTPAVAQAAKSKAVIDIYTGASWVGHVASPKASCENGRRATVYRKKPGNDAKIGTDKTESGKGEEEGVFVVPDPAPVEGATYYAKVKEKGNCDADKSKDFDYPDDQPF